MILIGLFLVLLISFYQDIRFRGIQWFFFPLIMVLSILYNWEEFLDYNLYNLAFIAFCLGSLTLYLTIKEGRLVNITHGFFSWGDILILIALSPLFTFERFVLFFTVGTILTLILHLLTSLIVRQKTIPYAGYMALFTIAMLMFDYHVLKFIKL